MKMVRLLTTALMIFFISSYATTNSVPVPVPKPTAQELICEYTQWDGCLDLAEPVAVITQNLPPGYEGVHYYGEPYIFIASSLPDADRWSTELHETAHYITYNLGITHERCQDESIARALEALILNRDYDYWWVDQYGCQAEMQ